MSKFTKEMVDNYADKLLIGLTPEENKMVLDEFEIIDKNIDLINEIPNISEIEPMTHTLDDFEYKLREDVSTLSTPIEDLLKNCDVYEGREVVATNKTYHLVGEYFEKGEIKNAVTSIMEYVNLANKYYDSREPWKQVKENISDFNDTTYTCLYMIANLSNLIEPVLPNASTKIKRMLNLNPYKWEEEMISGDYKLTDVEILYNRLEEKKLK